MKNFKQFLDEKGRCWTGYKPVPGKKPYSKGSCKEEEVEQIDEDKMDIEIIKHASSGMKPHQIAKKLDIPAEWVHQTMKHQMPKPERDLTDPRTDRRGSTRMGEEVELDEMDKSQKSQERHGDYPLGIKNKDANMVKPITSKKVKKDTLKLLNKLLKKEEVELDERSDYASRHPITKGIIGGRDKGAELFGGKKQYDTLANRRKPGHEVAHAKALGHQGGDEKEQQAKLKTALKSKNEEVEFYEEYDTEELFDILEEVVDGIAEESNIDPDILWENLEDVSDEELFETAAWRRKEGKNPTGGLNRKGIMSYRRENPGSKLSMAVTGKVKPGSKAAKRRKSFCARMGGMKGPMKKPNGEPTRKALALRKWKCR